MKVFKLNENAMNIHGENYTPPTRKLLGKIKAVKDIESALKLQKSIISAFQRGDIDSAESKSLSYLLQNFVSIYRLNLEMEKIYEVINFEVSFRIRELELLYKEYYRNIVVGLELTEEQIDKITAQYPSRISSIKDEIIALRKKVKKEITAQTTFTLKDDEPTEKKISKILNHIDVNLTTRERYLLFEELEKMIG